MLFGADYWLSGVQTHYLFTVLYVSLVPCYLCGDGNPEAPVEAPAAAPGESRSVEPKPAPAPPAATPTGADTAAPAPGAAHPAEGELLSIYSFIQTLIYISCPFCIWI